MSGRRWSPRDLSGTVARRALVVASGSAGLVPSRSSDRSPSGGLNWSPSFTPRGTAISTPPRLAPDRAGKHGGDAASAATTGPRRLATVRTAVAARDAPASRTRSVDAVVGAELSKDLHRVVGLSGRDAAPDRPPGSNRAGTYAKPPWPSSRNCRRCPAASSWGSVKGKLPSAVPVATAWAPSRTAALLVARTRDATRPRPETCIVACAGTAPAKLWMVPPASARSVHIPVGRPGARWVLCHACARTTAGAAIGSGRTAPSVCWFWSLSAAKSRSSRFPQ